MKLIECVPNFSEGRDRVVIDAITAQIEAVDGVMLLDVDPGEATNRTVVTFVGEHGPVEEAVAKGLAGPKVKGPMNVVAGAIWEIQRFRWLAVLEYDS